MLNFLLFSTIFNTNIYGLLLTTNSPTSFLKSSDNAHNDPDLGEIFTDREKICNELLGLQTGTKQPKGDIVPGMLYGVFSEVMYPIQEFCFGVQPNSIEMTHNPASIAGWSKIQNVLGTYNDSVLEKKDSLKHIAENVLKPAAKDISNSGPEQLANFLLPGGAMEIITEGKEVNEPKFSSSQNIDDIAVHFLIHKKFLPAAKEIKTVSGTVIANAAPEKYQGVENVTNIEFATALALINACSENPNNCANEKHFKFWLVETKEEDGTTSIRNISWTTLQDLWNQSTTMSPDLWNYKETVQKKFLEHMQSQAKVAELKKVGEVYDSSRLIELAGECGDNDVDQSLASFIGELFMDLNDQPQNVFTSVTLLERVASTDDKDEKIALMALAIGKKISTFQEDVDVPQLNLLYPQFQL